MKNEKNNPQDRISIREKIADRVDMSRDIILDSVVIKMSGNRQLMLENYKGILEYGDRCIRIKAKPKAVKIVGSGLEIRTITDEILYITGEFSGIMFTEE